MTDQKSEIPVLNTQSIEVLKLNFSMGCIILADKPKGWSSFKMVKKVRWSCDVKKAGHAGTLDPMATGLLIICTGKATKGISQIQDAPKVYEAEITLGASTPTYDAESEPDQTAEWRHVTAEMVQKAFEDHFFGDIEQIAPAYSALKHQGKPLYAYARKGEPVVEKKRIVHIFKTEIQEIDLPAIRVLIRCSKGTYIRSIANDLGLLLGTRAHLTGLRRTEIGAYTVHDALTINHFEEKL